jgi:hypothetical protein
VPRNKSGVPIRNSVHFRVVLFQNHMYLTTGDFCRTSSHRRHVHYYRLHANNSFGREWARNLYAKWAGYGAACTVVAAHGGDFGREPELGMPVQPLLR